MLSRYSPMQPTADTAPVKPLLADLIREVRCLADMTQVQFAAVIGVSYVTISRWETGRIQPSKLALRQVHAFIERLSQSQSQPIRDRSDALLATYFAKRQG